MEKIRYSAVSDATEITPILRKQGGKRFWEKIPVRYALAFLCFAGFVNVYAMRVNLSVGMVVMVNNSAYQTKDGSAKVVACQELLPQYHNGSNEASRKNLDGEFAWDPNTQALILGSFFYGYVATQIPGGVLAERWGAKWFFGIGVLVTSLFTLITPPAAHWGVTPFVLVRVTEGLAEGVTFPAANSLIGRWVPMMERSRMSALIYSGSAVGTVLAMAVSGVLADSSFLGGWPSIFYVFGALGCIWFGFWILLVYERPSEHPRITQSELNYIQQNRNGSIRTRRPIPWLSILTSIHVWALAITHFGQNWGFYTLLTEMPTYLSTVLHFDIKKNGVLSALPYVLQALFAYAGSYIADRLRQSGKFSITKIRKIMNSIAFFGPGVCVMLVAFAGCQPVLIVCLLCASVGLNGFMHSGFNVTHVDMSPEFAGTLMGITNCFSNMSGFLAPYVVGQITSRGQTIHSWSLVFVITSAVYFFTGALYDIFCTAELQPWGSASPTVPETASDLPAEPTKVPPPTFLRLPSKN